MDRPRRRPRPLPTFVGRIGAVDTVTLPLAALSATFVGLVALANIVAALNAHWAGQPPPAAILTVE